MSKDTTPKGAAAQNEPLPENTQAQKTAATGVPFDEPVPEPENWPAKEYRPENGNVRPMYFHLIEGEPEGEAYAKVVKADLAFLLSENNQRLGDLEYAASVVLEIAARFSELGIKSMEDLENPMALMSLLTKKSKIESISAALMQHMPRLIEMLNKYAATNQ